MNRNTSFQLCHYNRSQFRSRKLKDMFLLGNQVCPDAHFQDNGISLLVLNREKIKNKNKWTDNPCVLSGWRQSDYTFDSRCCQSKQGIFLLGNRDAKLSRKIARKTFVFRLPNGQPTRLESQRLFRQRKAVMRVVCRLTSAFLLLGLQVYYRHVWLTA